MKLKKAAMFGLDARIALVIFGALSVISGAALYNAIKDAKLVSFYSEIKELEKSFEAFWLDTGQVLPLGTGSIKYYKKENLFFDSSSISGWNGPYLNRGVDGYKLGPGVFSLYIYPSDNLGSDISSGSDCADNSNCFLWFFIDFVEQSNYSLLSDFDMRYDDGVSTTGSVRYGSASASRNYMYYKLMPVPKTW